MDLKTYELSEKAKYDKIWSKMDYSSKNLEEFYRFIKPYLYGRCLDIGCGRGTLVEKLTKEKLFTVGIDISLKGVFPGTKGYFHENPVWRTGFRKKAFDVSFSTDVLEHVPMELVPLAIQEIDRVTGGLTLHHIATFDDHEYFGERVHLTVMPIGWWMDQFKECKCKVLLRERKLWR